MKNRGVFCLVLICCACLVFTGGFFIGRNYNRTPIQLSTLPASSDTGAGPAFPSEQLNINTATLAQLQALPGIGPTLAQRILEHRQKNGPFTSVGELTGVEGIGEGKLEAILEYITVG